MMRAALLIAAVLLIAAPSLAACIDPVMAEGSIFFNSDFETMQYCSDTRWVTFDGPGIYCAEGDGIVMTSSGWACSPGGPP